MVIMRYRLLKDHQGLTLIELIIALAILLLVLSVVFNFFIFGVKSFDVAERRSEIQLDVRLASDFITTRLRNATSLSLTDNSLANTIDLTLLQTRFTTIEEVFFEIHQESGRYIIWYKIIGRDASGELEYELESDVLLNNISSATLGTGEEIYYQ